MRKETKVGRKAEIVSWCNGSTTGFGSVCLGSSPSGITDLHGGIGVHAGCSQHDAQRVDCLRALLMARNRHSHISSLRVGIGGSSPSAN